MYYNTSGSSNTAIGLGALTHNTTGYSNIAIGVYAAFSNTTQANLVAVGDSALYNNSTGYLNTALGSKTLWLNTTGFDNTALGSRALQNNTSGWNNTAVGIEALINNSTGNYNTAIGSNSLYANTTGYRNTTVGEGSNLLNTTGYNNTAFGQGSLILTTTGWQNTAIGSATLNINETGSYNTTLGYNTGPNGYNYVNTTCLGIDATATGFNMVRIGNTFVTSIGGYVNWSNISDGRFKENVKEDVPGLSFITQLRPVTYQLNRDKINELNGVNERRNKIKQENPETEFLSGDKYSEVTTGFIAQEVEDVAKKLGFTFSGVDAPKNDNDFYGLRYAEFVVPLVKAVQELNDENNLLKTEIENTKIQLQQVMLKLQTEIDQLKQQVIVVSSNR